MPHSTLKFRPVSIARTCRRRFDAAAGQCGIRRSEGCCRPRSEIEFSLAGKGQSKKRNAKSRLLCLINARKHVCCIADAPSGLMDERIQVDSFATSGAAGASEIVL